MKLGKIFMFSFFFLASSLSIFAQFSKLSGYTYGSDKERSGIFGSVREVIETFVFKDNYSIDGTIYSTDRTISVTKFEYDCKGGLIKRIVNTGGITETYVYSPTGGIRTLKYSSFSAQSIGPPHLYKERSSSQENFIIIRNSYEREFEAKFDGFVLTEDSFVDLEQNNKESDNKERAWRDTYIFNSDYRLVESRSIKGKNFIPTRNIYTYQKDSLHPDTMTEEEDYQTVRKYIYTYKLDDNKNWIKRVSTLIYFYPQRTETRNYSVSRQISYFAEGECQNQ